MPRTPDLPCADCGKLLWQGRTSLPEGKARCMPCRRAERNGSLSRSQTRPCIDCGRDSYGQRCRQCDGKHRRRDTPKTGARKLLEARRTDRDRLAPGPYTATNRRYLLARWKKQHRLCVYCSRAPVETVDHVLPLALGGTNYEGNLVPACHDCNRSKLDNMLSAWRYGIKVRKWRVPVEPRLPKARPRRKAVVGKQTVMQICDVCGWADGHRVSSYECFRTKMRNRYRDRVGIPRDAPLHTRAA